MSYKKSLLVTSILAALSNPVLAEEYSQFDEVVVSATRTETSTQDVSATIGKISGQDLEKTMSQNIKDAVKYEPGVTAQGGGRFGISGFNIRGMDNSRVKIMVDGVQQPVAYNPGADVMRKYPNSFEIDTLHSIEINKGPSSTLYGSGSLGGSVLLRTKSPADLLEDGDDTYTAFKTGYMSADESFKNTLSFANRSGQLETLLIYTYTDANELQTHSSGSDITGPNRGAADPYDNKTHNILAKAFYQVNDDHRIGLTTEYYNHKADGENLSTNGSTMDIPMPGGMTMQYKYDDSVGHDDDTRLRVGFEHEWEANNGLFDKLKWKVNHQSTASEHETDDVTDITTCVPVAGCSTKKRIRTRERNAEDTSIQFDSQFEKAFSLEHSEHLITYGVDFLENKFEIDYTDHIYSDNTVTPKAPEVPDAKSQQWGIFLQDNAYLLDEQLVLNAGIRYDSFKAKPYKDEAYTKENPSNSSDAVTAKLGAVYHWTEEFSTFGQVSQGFKSPTLYDLYYVYEQGAVVKANPDLKPEESISYELGLRNVTKATKLELVGYYNDYKNFIEKRATAEKENNKDVFTNVNIGEVKIYGLELSGTILLDDALGAPQGLYTKASIAYAKGENSLTKKSLDSIAPLTANIGLGYDSANYVYGANLDVTAVARKTDWSDTSTSFDVDGTNMDAPGYAVVDLTAYYRPTNDITLRAGLFNALDKKYWQYNDLSGKDGNDKDLNRKTQPGRNWGINANWEF